MIRAALIPIVLAGASLSFGQTYSNGSAQASQPVGPGTVNYVEGQVTVNGEELGRQSIGSATLKPGEVLDTGQGYAELLLTPGAFLRVGNNSEVRLTTAGLADTKIDVVRGEAILEADQLIKGTNLAATVGNATTTIEKNGLYDFNAAQNTVKVLDGKATVETAAGKRNLDKNSQVLLASNHPLKKHSVDEKSVQAEPLYVWSKARSEAEAQASVGAAQNATLYSMAGPGWYWDPAWGFYGFWPADAALFSPFGWGFYSPAYFGFGYYGGLWGGGWYGHPIIGVRPIRTVAGTFHGRVSGINARVGGFSGFHGGGFHGGFAGGGFHGGFGGGHR
jgi:hypothetical protein